MERKFISKIQFLILILVVLFILLAVFVIYPLFKDIKAKSQELVSQKEKLVILESTVMNLEKFRVLYQDLDETLDKIDSLFINSELPVDFISFLERTSEECSMDSEISLGSVGKAEKSFWTSVSFQITVRGSSSNFLKFLEKLENSPYLIDIQKLTLNQINEKIGANLSISVYAK